MTPIKKLQKKYPLALIIVLILADGEECKFIYDPKIFLIKKDPYSIEGNSSGYY